MMKNLIALIAFVPLMAFAGGVVKEVCHDEVQKGKTVKVCKKVKVHQKLEGTKVPPK